MSAGLDYEDDDATPIACRACGGTYRFEASSRNGGQYSTVCCRWCTRGAQSPKQYAQWIAHKASHKSGVRAKVGK